MAAGSVGKVLAASCANLRTCLCVSRIHTKKEVWKKATCNPSTGEESRGTPELLGASQAVGVTRGSQESGSVCGVTHLHSVIFQNLHLSF